MPEPRRIGYPIFVTYLERANGLGLRFRGVLSEGVEGVEFARL